MQDQNGRIYLDYNATTPLDPAVLERMLPYLREHFGNPASGQHAWGWAAESAVARARKQTAALIGSEESEILFTSGATESNNWALFGFVRHWKRENPGRPLHILTSSVEHSSIVKACPALADDGIEVEVLPVLPDGRVEVERVRRALKPHTGLMSFIWVNNEIGSINPIRELAELARERRVYLHSDATQAVGKIPVDVKALPVDMISFSAHKIYGPKGAGALYLRSKDPKVRIEPLLFGGGQEKGIRSGTLNVPGIVGLGEAAEICAHELPREKERLETLRDRLLASCLEEIPGCRLNGHARERSPMNLSLSFPGRPVDLALPKLQKIGFSTGSACSAGRVSISHVLKGLGVSEEDAQCTLRLSIGRWTTAEHIEAAAWALKEAFAGR